MSRSKAISLAVGLCVACGGSSNGSTPGDDAGGLADSNGALTPDSSSGTDAAGGGTGPGAGGGTGPDAGGVGPGSTGIDAGGGNSGNGQDCTSCMLPTPYCCVTYGGGGVQSVTCVAAQSACPAGTGGFACLAPADCPTGMVCCESGTGTNLSTSCASTCPTTSQVCQVSADCPNAASGCPMNGNRGDIGYGVCSPPRDAGAPPDAGGASGDAGAADGSAPIPDASAVDVAVPSDGAADSGAQDAVSGG